ncbi:MAG TPA: lysophospholipid acyltransferase family protein [Salinivirgaceae bacterium]|nr:lysophospholipid acyltransferase family protein [Salinivirgaceae bacterium]
MYLIGHMPFWMLYGLSDFLRFMLFYVIRYRRKVVFSNFNRCFPEKSEREIRQIAWKFYRNLADITLESIKGFYLSKEEICRRWRVINPELLDDYYRNNRDVLNLAAHYANWEWGILALDAQIKHQAVSIYKPMSNQRMENWSRAKRERFGMQLVPIWRTKEFFGSPKEKPVSVVLAADQNPTNKDKAIVVKFFGYDTACLHGPEAFGRGAGIPLVYFDVQRVKRGFYTMEIIPMFDNPQKTTPTEITRVYMSKVEAVIRQKPEDYLWSHRRWKHSVDEINEMLARQNSVVNS